MMVLSNQTQKGRSMIEMLGVLAIIGVLSVGGIQGFSKAMDTHKVNQTIDNVASIVTNVKNIGMRQNGRYAGLNTAAAIKMKLVPEDLIQTNDSTQKIVHSFGGEIQVGTSKELWSNSKNTGEKDFAVVLTNLSRDACLQIVSKDWGGDKTAIAASATNNFKSKTEMSTYNVKTGKAECKSQSSQKFAVCYNMNMPVSTAAAACACGTGFTCAVAIWSL